MGDAGTVAVWAAFIGPMVAIGACTVFGLMCFPSIREVVVERFRHRTLRHAEAADIVGQIAQLRGEVYALRTELAQATRALPPTNGNIPNIPIDAGSTQGRISS